ncbi:MAG: cytochrome c-type biogenesis protein CcmH [Leptospira sp.]|nr:cytochrome c-type biogenesis protein CcmH [Leptospira sp.]
MNYFSIFTSTLYKVKKSLSLFAICLLVPFSIYAQTTTTSLKDQSQINTFLEVTEKIRCICLPSLPIQACSFNMCTASAYLKNFIENRIKDGMQAEDIIYQMEHGFGDKVLNDPVVIHFQEDGNQGMVDSIVYGFGDKILAKPDSTYINLTLIILGFIGLTGIWLYFKKFNKSDFKKTDSSIQVNTTDIQKQIKKWEDQA